MKTIKINDLTHEALKTIKKYYQYKTLDETIDMAIGEFIFYNGDGFIQKIIKKIYNPYEKKK